METIEINQAAKILNVKQAMLDGSVFNDISFKNVKITNANMSDLEIEGAQLGGAYIHNIGMPPQGHPLFDPEKKQLPLRFEDCNLQGTHITNCNLSGSVFDDISFKNVKITNANMSGMEIEGAQLGGAYIHNIGMPPQGHLTHNPDAIQRPLRFEDCNLTGSTITDCNLSGVIIADCNIQGMKINGILVEDLLKVYASNLNVQQ